LKKANSRRGLKRRMNLAQYSNTVSGSTLVWSTWGHSITASWQDQRSYEAWGTVRWFLRDSSQLGSSPDWLDATRTALGLHYGNLPIYVWKSIPWTWMIDWFAGISDVLQANYNMIYYRPSKANIMQKFDSVRVYTAPPLLALQKPETYASQRKRTTTLNPAPSLSMRVPFLDTFKLSILSSLTIVGIRRRQ